MPPVTCTCGSCLKCRHREYVRASRAKRKAEPEQQTRRLYGDQRQDDLSHYCNYFRAEIIPDPHSQRERRGMMVVRQLEAQQ